MCVCIIVCLCEGVTVCVDGIIVCLCEGVTVCVDGIIVFV